MFDINSVSLRNEKEIISNWIDSENICVSIVCPVYNHGEYIESCLIGFLMQETKFAFEIIVHDDASTDNSKDIIEKYYSLYPNIIKPTYQKENQYSKGNFKPIPYCVSMAKGLYIAICEGDDYWVDPRKLEKQKLILDENIDLNLCFTKAIEFDETTNTYKEICNYGRDGVIPGDIIIKNRGGAMATASIMLRLSSFNYIMKNCHKFAIGDFFIMSYFAITNRCYYINDASVVYRRNSIGSWTSSQKDLWNRFIFSAKIIESIRLFMSDLRKYEKAIYLRIPMKYYFVQSVRLYSKNISFTSTRIMFGVIKNYLIFVLSTWLK